MLELLPTCLFDASQYHPDIFLLHDVWIAERVIYHQTACWGTLSGTYYTLTYESGLAVLDEHDKPYLFDTPTEALAALPAGFVAHQERESEALV